MSMSTEYHGWVSTEYHGLHGVLWVGEHRVPKMSTEYYEWEAQSITSGKHGAPKVVSTEYQKWVSTKYHEERSTCEGSRSLHLYRFHHPESVG